MLAGIGVSWLTRIEQGGADNVSADVLSSLADVLRLDPAERRHLFALAGQSPSAALVSVDGASAEHLRLVESLAPLPAYLLDPVWNLVAWNDPLADLVPSVATTPEPNLVEMYLRDDSVRELIVDWDAEVRHLIAQFRLHLASFPSAEADLLVDELHTEAIFFEEWDRLEVEAFVPTRREFDHPTRGRIALDQHRLALTDAPGWHVTVFAPA